MLSDKDYAVVAEMARTGMNPDVLKMCFPKLDPTELEQVYLEEQKRKENDTEEEITIKCNCS